MAGTEPGDDVTRGGPFSSSVNCLHRSSSLRCLTYASPGASWPGLSHGCPVRFVLEERTTLILLVSGVCDSSGPSKGINAVRHQNSVFHDVLKLIPWAAFDRLVERARRRTSWCASSRPGASSLRCCTARLAGATSLREIEADDGEPSGAALSCRRRGPARSTFADANRIRSPLVFSGLFEHMLGMAHARVRRKMGEAVRLIEFDQPASCRHRHANGRAFRPRCAAPRRISSTIPTSAARSTTRSPRPTSTTSRRQEDADRAGRHLRLRSRLLRLCLVGRARRGWLPHRDAVQDQHAAVQAEMLAAPRAASVLSDRIGFLPARQASSRRNPMQVRCARSSVMTETGKTLRILTNDLDAPAQEIADLYKRRWQIELFFRVMKQTLRITHFIGRLGKRGAHSDRRRADRFPASALGRRHHASRRAKPPRVRSTRAYQPHAQAPSRPLARSARTSQSQSKPVKLRTILPMNRTAVGLSRPSTRLTARIFVILNVASPRRPQRRRLPGRRRRCPGQAHGCPVRFCCAKRTTLISNGFQGLTTHWTRKGPTPCASRMRFSAMF